MARSSRKQVPRSQKTLCPPAERQESARSRAARSEGPPCVASTCSTGRSSSGRNASVTCWAAAKFAATDERLSWHSLRHSFASLLATDLELPSTTLARLTGHADAGFTLRVYARDGRDEAAVVEDVLARAAGAGVGA